MATPNLGIILPGSEEDAYKVATYNTADNILDQAIAGYLSLSVAGSSDVTLTNQASGTPGTQALNFAYQLTGALTGDINVKFPATGGSARVFIIFNNTTGAHTVTVKTTAGGSSGIAVTQGKKRILFTDGTNVYDALTEGGGSITGAASDLSNLSGPTAVNAALLPGTAGGLDFGSAAKPWAALWFAGTSGTPGTNNFEITGASTSGTRIITAPDANTKLPIVSQFLTLTGPSAPRTITLPDAAFTVARSDAVQPMTGTPTNDNAAAGKIGEYVSSIVTVGSPVSLTTVTPANVTNISLTAGDWDVWIDAYFILGTSTTVVLLRTSISSTSATIDTTPGNFSQNVYPSSVLGSTYKVSIRCGPRRVSLAGTTTIYMVTDADFGVSTVSAYGIIRARRVR